MSGAGPGTLRVVVADDHPMFRRGLAATLAATPGMDVVGEASTGDEAVRVALAQQPAVVVMDLHMPNLNGIDATRQILSVLPEVGVLVLSMLDDDESVFAAMRAGARGYLLKGADRDEIVRSVKSVADGGAVFGAALARRLIGYFSTGAQQAKPFPALTQREREVLELLAQGRGNAEIARALYVNVKTVRNHVSNVFTKLQVADRGQAIVRARQAGLGEAGAS